MGSPWPQSETGACSRRHFPAPGFSASAWGGPWPVLFPECSLSGDSSNSWFLPTGSQSAFPVPCLGECLCWWGLNGGLRRWSRVLLQQVLHSAHALSPCGGLPSPLPSVLSSDEGSWVGPEGAQLVREAEVRAKAAGGRVGGRGPWAQCWRKGSPTACCQQPQSLQAVSFGLRLSASPLPISEGEGCFLCYWGSAVLLCCGAWPGGRERISTCVLP